MKLPKINKEEVAFLAAVLLKQGVKSLQKMLFRFSLLAKKAVLLAYNRRYSVLHRLILIQNVVSGTISALYKRMSASSSQQNVLAYLHILRSLLLKLITFQLFRNNNTSQSQPINTSAKITSRQYTGGFNFFDHRIQLSISQKEDQTTGSQPPFEQQEEQATTTTPAEDAYLSMPQCINTNENNTTTVKATMTSPPPSAKSPGLDLHALAKYSKMNNTPRREDTHSAIINDNNDDTSVQLGNKQDSIPAVLFP